MRRPDPAYDAQWYFPTSWPGWGEEERLARVQRPAPVQATDNVQQPQVLILGPRGEPLVVRQPRPIGFRKP